MYFAKEPLYKVGDSVTFNCCDDEELSVYGFMVPVSCEPVDGSVRGEVTRVWRYHSIGPGGPRSEYFYEINGDSRHRYAEASSVVRHSELRSISEFPVDDAKFTLGKVICVSVKTRCPIIDLNEDYTDDMMGKCVFEQNGELYVSPARAVKFVGDKEVEEYDAFFNVLVAGIWYDCTNGAGVEYELKQPSGYELDEESELPAGMQFIFDNARLISGDKERSYRLLMSDGVTYLREDKTVFVDNKTFCKASVGVSAEEIGFPSLASERYFNENRVFRIPDVRKGAAKKSTAF